MNQDFFRKIENILHEERIDAYRQDGADPALTLARYSLNMALGESLYPALQFAEVALRNAIHRAMTTRCQTDDWFDTADNRLTPWQKTQVSEARKALTDHRKSITPGRMVAELNFGFWTGFFNKAHGQTGVGHYLAHTIYPYAPFDERNLNKLGERWRLIRNLRNRVFHHERVLHWKDLDAQHRSVLEVIAWISPELHELAVALDRFDGIRSAGLEPWLAKVRRHWPVSAPGGTPAYGQIATVNAPFDAATGADTPFGHRWGGEVLHLSDAHLTAMHNGQTLALDVMSEYVVFLRLQPDELLHPREPLNP
ncbi:MAG: Abi family protein [Chromatiaceae bacterium]|nr:Abi family protein [Chromatiaceae bacterium]